MIELLRGPQDGLKTKKVPIDGMLRIPRMVFFAEKVTPDNQPYFADLPPYTGRLKFTVFDIYKECRWKPGFALYYDTEGYPA